MVQSRYDLSFSLRGIETALDLFLQLRDPLLQSDNLCLGLFESLVLFDPHGQQFNGTARSRPNPQAIDAQG